MYWNIIIGALIGLACSSVGTLLSHHFHMRERKQERGWKIEDDESKIKRDITYKRLEELEDLVHRIGFFISKIRFKIAMVGLPMFDQLDDEVTELLIQSGSESYTLHLFYYFKDDQLIESFDKLIDLQNDLININVEISEKMINSDYEGIEEYTSKFSDLKVEEVFNNVIERIDFLKMKYSK